MNCQERLRLKLTDRVRRNMLPAHAASYKLPTLPGVQSFSVATRYVDGGRERVLEFIQMAMLDGKPESKKFWDVYADLLVAERRIVSFDDICAAAGVRPSRLLAELTSTAMEQGQEVGNLVAAATHPAVVAKAAESALRTEGEYADIAYKDRRMLLEHHGFVPTQQGTVVNVNAHANATARSASLAANNPSVPSFTENLEALQPARKIVQRELQEAHASEEAQQEILDGQVLPEPAVLGE